MRELRAFCVQDNFLHKEAFLDAIVDIIEDEKLREKAYVLHMSFVDY